MTSKSEKLNSTCNIGNDNDSRARHRACGRPRKNEYVSLAFEYIQSGSKYNAKCNVCNKLLKNTAISRLKLHR